MNDLIPQFVTITVFLSILVMHLARKNFSSVMAYTVQSLAVIILVISLYFETKNASLLLIAALLFVVKVIVAPNFLYRTIKRYKLSISSGKYLGRTISLVVMVLLTIMAHADKLSPLMSIVPQNQNYLSLAFSAMALSIFLVLNSRGAISQVIGILSLENSIVLFAILAGLEQSVDLQIGIIFDIFVWVIIATAFVSMIHKHFGSIDVSRMNNLTD